MDKQTCRECQNEYPINNKYFHRNRSVKTGFEYICKTCKKKRSKAYYEKHFKKVKKEYALYKGDELLSVGTRQEIAEEMGIKRQTVSIYGTDSYKKRAGKNIRVLIELED